MRRRVIEKLPEAARKLRKDLSTARAGAPTALQNMQEAAQELQGAAADAGAPAGQTRADSARARAAPAPAPEPTWLRDYTLAQSALLVTVAAQTPIVLLLTYFLLASGGAFPAQAGAARRAVAVAQEGCRAHPRGNRRAGAALPARHARVERAARRRHLARVPGARPGAGGRLGRRRRRAALHSLPRPGADRAGQRRGRVPAVRLAALRARRRGRLAAGGGHRSGSCS